MSKTDPYAPEIHPLHEVLASTLDPTKREGTSYPWWAIVRGRGPNKTLLEGPFFSREEAEEMREAKPQDYGRSSYVYCFSGHRSFGYCELIALAKDSLAEARGEA
jgi:hypothetical protein